MKRIVIFLGIGIFLLLIANALFVKKEQKTTNQQAPVFPTKTVAPVILNKNTSDFYVVSNSSSDKTTKLPQDQKITVIFNKSFTQQDINIFISPTIAFTTQVQNNQLTIIPTSPAANIIYTYTIRDSNMQPLAFGSFFTEDSISPAIPGRGYDNLEQSWDEMQKATNTSFYIAGKLIETPQTGVTSTFTSTPTRHYFFTITSSDKTAGKNTFVSWLKSLGLTDAQIALLDTRTE